MDKLNFYATNRKDEMLSLFHMLVCLLNDNQLYGDIAMIKEIIQAQNNPELMVNKMRVYRKKHDIKNIMKNVLKNKMLLSLTEEIKG